MLQRQRALRATSPFNKFVFDACVTRKCIYRIFLPLSLSRSSLSAICHNAESASGRVAPRAASFSMRVFLAGLCVCVECDFGELLSRVIRESEREEANRVRLLWMESGGGRDARVLRRSCLPFSSTL